MFRIRPSNAADLARVDALLARSYPRLLKADYPPSVLVTALPIISRAQPRLLTSGTYFVAETEEGAIVGAGGWTPRGRVRGIGAVRHLVTSADHTRQGIATALMEQVFASARAAGIVHMECQATRTAVPFYRSVGFAERGAIAIDLAPGVTFPAIAMHRAL